MLPSNEGRGYVLRKILRRGIRHGRLLGQEKPFLFQMVFAVRDLMQGAYPELAESAARVAKVVEAEEKQFDRVLKLGLVEWEKCVADLVNNFSESFLQEKPAEGAFARYHHFDENVVRVEGAAKSITFPGEKAFHLYETFGLPLDFMKDAAHDAGIGFDDEGFEAARAEEQARARASWKGGSQKSASPAYRELPKTEFLGYKQLTANDAEVLAIVKDGVGVPAAKAGDLVDVVLDQTSFYGDSGGQTGDTGWFPVCGWEYDGRRDSGLRAAGAGGARAQGSAQGAAGGWRSRAHGGRWGAAQCDPAESYGDASAARGAAAGAGDACEAGRVGGASGSAALRFFALCAGGR